MPWARGALGLLLAINLFNYIDRYVLAAVEPAIRKEFFPDDPNAMAKTGLLATAFLFSYMIIAPIFGWLADRMNRWILVGISVIVWSLASGASGLAGVFAILLITRLFVGVGEAGYGPAAPTLISDYYPVRRRGAVLSWFYMAIPVGSALGYALGGIIAKHWGWRHAFYAVVGPGILLGVACFFMPEPTRGEADRLESSEGGETPSRQCRHRPRLKDYLVLLRIRSYVLDCIGMTALTFAIGGISYFMPAYLVHRKAGDLAFVNIVFGVLTAVGGLVATLRGGIAGDKLRNRFPGSYFLVSAAGVFIACPMVIGLIYTPFPYAWGFIFGAVFFLFFNTGPSNTILANVTHPSIRASAFAMNIFVIHLLGDALSPPLLGKVVGDQTGWNAALLVVAGVTALAGVVWLWGARYLATDTAAATKPL